MTRTAVVYESLSSGERLEVELPLTSTYPLDSLREQVGLPDYLNLEDPNVARAVGVLWAADQAAREQGGADGSIVPLLFGGVAIRMLAPSANAPGPFMRRMGDLDLIVQKAGGRQLVDLISGLGDKLGTQFWHVVTKSDKNFNGLRGGSRYRLHGLRLEGGEEEVTSCVLDVLVDKIQFCHEIPLDDAFGTARENLFTVGASRLLATKLQAIQAVRREDVPAEMEYRVIGSFGKDALIGPEDKDLLDALALLVDRGVGEGSNQVNPAILGKLIQNDWRLAKTLTLNLENLEMFDRALVKRDADSAVRATAKSAIEELTNVLSGSEYQPREPRFRMSKRWWEPVEDAGHS